MLEVRERLPVMPRRKVEGLPPRRDERGRRQPEQQAPKADPDNSTDHVDTFV